MMIARLLVAKWFVIGLVSRIAWGKFLELHLPLLSRWPLSFPPALLATLPAYLAWMGLWWAQYPADRALREQGLLAQLENDLPIHSPPGFWSFFIANLRLQILFTVVPVMLILLLRDIAFMTLWGTGMIARDSRAEPLILLTCSAIIFITAPLFLTLILRTQPLPHSALRARLEDICRRTKLRYRDILLWQTDNNMGNAAVMGLIPQVRYILLSDLLLESMTDDQVEAVFAHEVGHIVHRHMAWYVVLIVILMLAMSLAAAALTSYLPWLSAQTTDIVLNGLGLLTFAGIFGYLSRKFERQADVYAARTIDVLPVTDTLQALPACVGEVGASTFAAALYRVAIVNNIPVRARNFTHGSIASRMNYLHRLSNEPQLLADFDRLMFGVYATLITALLACGAAAWVWRDRLIS